MALDNGTANAQPHPHSVTLGCIEGFKESLHVSRCDAHARVLHCQPHAVAFVFFGSDDQLSRTVINADHCVRSVLEQIEHDLLKLDTIACNPREIVGKLLAQDYAVFLKLLQAKRDDLACGLIQVNRSEE